MIIIARINEEYDAKLKTCQLKGVPLETKDINPYQMKTRIIQNDSINFEVVVFLYKKAA